MQIEEQFKFTKYIQNKKEKNYNSQISKITKYIYTSVVETNSSFPNIIIYGAEGTGKYSIALEYIEKFSKSSLHYEKKCNVEVNKEDLYFKLSDIHYEIDIDRLGCNQKTSFLNYYNHILEIIKNKKHLQLKQNKIHNTKPYIHELNGIILIKNFHNISLDLLNIFDSFLKYKTSMLCSVSNIKICFILLTKNISFLNDTICDLCTIIQVPKPLLSKMKIKISKDCLYEENNLNIIQYNNTVCLKSNENYNTILRYLNNDTLHIEEFRNALYTILIHQEDIFEIIYKVVRYMVCEKDIDIYRIMKYVEKFNTYFNNNYRPIFHLENLFVSFYLDIHKMNK